MPASGSILWLVAPASAHNATGAALRVSLPTCSGAAIAINNRRGQQATLRDDWPALENCQLILTRLNAAEAAR